MADMTLPREAEVKANWWILVSIGIGTFMTALDGSVVNTILPVIRQYFNSDVATVEWAVVVYLLVVSCLLLTFGRVGDLYGYKIVYLGGFGLFVFSSALCGLAPTPVLLVLFRMLQAMGGAMLLANSPAILTRNFPARQRGQVLGMQATMTYLGLTAGPSLGGWLAHAFSWRTVFYINVPIGVLAVLLSLRNIPADRKSDSSERFDLGGALLFMAGLVALLLGLNQGHAWGWWSPAIVGLLFAAVVLLAAFIFYEGRVQSPMLDLSLFSKRLFSASAGTALLNYVAMYCILFLLPFYLIQGRGLNSAQAGLLLTAQPLVMAVAAPLSGTLSDRIGSRLPATLGMLLLSAGILILSSLGPASPFWMVSLGLAVAGLGTGIFVSPNNSALLGSAPRHRQGIASGMLATARNVGMVLGIGMAGAIFTTLTSSAAPDALFGAVHTGLLVAAGVALLSALVASVRGNGEKKE
jgi:EmrB/QacA subfamily drug resistance transporter